MKLNNSQKIVSSSIVAIMVLSAILARLISLTSVLSIHAILVAVDAIIFVWFVLFSRVLSVKGFFRAQKNAKYVMLVMHFLGVFGSYVPFLVKAVAYKTYVHLYLVAFVLIFRVMWSRLVVPHLPLDKRYQVQWRRGPAKPLSEIDAVFEHTEELIEWRRSMQMREIATEMNSVAQPIQPVAVQRPHANPVARKKTHKDVSLGLFDGDLRNSAYSMQPLLLKAPHISKWRFIIKDRVAPFPEKRLALTVVDELVSALVADSKQSIVEKSPEFFRQRAYTYAGLNIPHLHDAELRDASSACAYWMSLHYDEVWAAAVSKPTAVIPYNWVPLALLIIILVAIQILSFNYACLCIPLVVAGLCWEGALFSSF